MSTLLKDEISAENIKKLALLLKAEFAPFDVQMFQQSVFSKGWPELTLKQRIRHVSAVLQQCLPMDYQTQILHLSKVQAEFSGLFHLVFADFVELNGLDHFNDSINALALFTENSSSEFAIRRFIQNSPEQLKPYLLAWSQSDNHHLRRLASEGVRPRLPWAQFLPFIEQNPDWVLPIIENLKNDDSRYVQKSVANLLNDLSKNNRDWVLEQLNRWDLKQKNSAWIAKHALRTLLKKGDKGALSLMGYKAPNHIQLSDLIVDKQVLQGGKCHFSFVLNSSESLGVIRLEYAISFLRQKQKPYRKVFKISESEVLSSQKLVSSFHDFKPITTRKYFAGKHLVEFIINGTTVAQSEFELQ